MVAITMNEDEKAPSVLATKLPKTPKAGGGILPPVRRDLLPHTVAQ
jgi:hypothetical protein